MLDQSRRKFMALLGAAATWPLTVRAQQPTAPPVVGLLVTSSPRERAAIENLTAFRRGLAETGRVDGRNVTIEPRWVDGHPERLPALAAELVSRSVAVIATLGGSPAALAAKGATSTIPIVFAVGVDPVEFGLVASLQRPGGNLTGITDLNSFVAAKRLEVLHELVPTTTSIGLLINPSNRATVAIAKDVQEPARILGVGLLVLDASDESELEGAFATLVQRQAGALMTSADPLFFNQRDDLVALAARYAVPVLSPFNEFTAAGGLLSYGTNQADIVREVGVYAGRILNGAKPADLPVQQATKIRLSINMKAAKALGLTFPLTLLGRADEVIE
jgi:putative ABC transport system substrate-binding protein